MDATRRMLGLGSSAAAGLLRRRPEGEGETATATVPENQEAAEDGEDDDNEAMEDDNEDDQGYQKSQTETWDQLLLLFAASPEDPLLRAAVTAEIKRRYINNGGLPINTKDPIPVDLDAISPKELIHVAENMEIYLVRSRKDDIVSKFLNIFSNVSYLAARFGGLSVDAAVNRAFSSDHVLRQSFVEVFVGKTAQIHPILTLGVACVSHLSNILVQSIDGQRGHDSSRIVINGQVQSNTTAAQQQGTESGSVSNTSAPPTN
jgi:hypothetical protein